MGRELVLISGDGELAAAVAAVLPEADRLTVVDPEEDLPAFAGPALGGPAVVVVDLPPASRHGVCEHLRANYPGQVIVLVDPGEGSGEDPQAMLVGTLARGRLSRRGASWSGRSSRLT